MRSLIPVLTLLLMVQFANANVITVSNDPSRPAQYSSISVAFTAANPGDTLYLFGSPGSYDDLTITKSIAIIGGGFNTRSEKFDHSELNNITLDNNVSGVKLEGLTFHSLFANTSTAYNYSNISIKNCLIYSELFLQNAPCGSVLNGWLIQNSIVSSLTIRYNPACSGIHPTTANFLVKNSLINTVPNYGCNYNISFVNCQFGFSSGVLPGNYAGAFNGLNNCTFDNCMFIKMNFIQGGLSVNNLFHNCLTYQTFAPSANFDLNNWPDGTPNSATGTIVNQNPLWVTESFNIYSQPLIYSPVSWSPVLQAGSPALNAGTDGSDVGITGGSTPYDYHAEPNIPIVRKFQIINSIVPPNGTLNIKATATKAQ